MRRLEAEGIAIIRETFASFRNPVLLYSIGKDSSVVLHLVQKAFAPSRLALPLLHIATGWNFRAMLEFRDRRAAELGARLIVHSNPEGLRLDLPRFCGETLGQAAAILSNCAGLVKSRAEWSRTGL